MKHSRDYGRAIACSIAGLIADAELTKSPASGLCLAQTIRFDSFKRFERLKHFQAPMRSLLRAYTLSHVHD